MTTAATVALSLLDDSRAAGRAAAAEAVKSLGTSAVDLTLVFATGPHRHDELLAGVAEHVDPRTIVGCSGEGTIAGRVAAERDLAVALLAVRSDALRFRPLLVEGYSDDPGAAGRALAAAVSNEEADDALGLWLFPDGLTGDCSTMLEALRAGLSKPLTTLGGTAADAMAFEHTYQFRGTDVHTGAVAAVLVSGSGALEVAVSHGCTPIGRPRRITRSDGRWVHEIDGQPAWDVFKDYLDGKPTDLNAEGIVHLCVGCPLSEADARAYAPYVIRTPLALDKASGSLLFPGGGLDAGQTIIMTRRDPDRIRESARACAVEIRDRHPGRRPALVLQVDCAGRGKILFGAEVGDELVVPLQEVLGRDVPWIGFNSYGEIAPIGGRAWYHNYTVALCALYDEP